MRNVLPPRPGGVQAALAAAPHADVVFVAHTGLEHLSTVRDLWRGLPMDSAVVMRWDFVPAAEVPRTPKEQQDWLFEHWAVMDAWVERHRPSAPTAQPPSAPTAQPPSAPTAQPPSAPTAR
jgi:hypothetical protein